MYLKPGVEVVQYKTVLAVTGPDAGCMVQNPQRSDFMPMLLPGDLPAVRSVEEAPPHATGHNWS